MAGGGYAPGGGVRWYRAIRSGSHSGIYRDFAALPEAHQQRLRDRDSYFGDVLAAPFGCAEDDHRRLRAVIGHATSFWTWRSLCIDHGVADTEAVDAMTGMVLALTWAGQPARGR